MEQVISEIDQGDPVASQKLRNALQSGSPIKLEETFVDDMRRQIIACLERQDVAQQQAATGVEKLFRFADLNQSGTIEFVEFMRLCGAAVGTMDHRHLISLFWHLDLDGSGALDLSEFQAWLKLGQTQRQRDPSIRLSKALESSSQDPVAAFQDGAKPAHRSSSKASTNSKQSSTRAPSKQSVSSRG